MKSWISQVLWRFWWDYAGRNCDIFQLDKKIQITRLDHP
jgi:hypothetical protein